VIPYAGSLSAAAALRFFAEGRQRLGWWSAGAALILFAAWSVPIHYSVAVAAVLAGAALAAMAAATPDVRASAATTTIPTTSSPDATFQSRPALGPSVAEPTTVSAARHARSRIPVIIAVTLATLAWIGIALLWFVFREGENVQCNCWADNRSAWQYGGQFLAAIIGTTGLGLIARFYLRDRRRSLLAAVLVSTSAVGAWILFFTTGT
jgi:hypothetical protein